MTTLTIALPDGIFEAVRKAPDEVAQEMRIAVAVRWYAQGLISQGKGAEIAALTRSQFIDALGLAGVPACQETISEIRDAAGEVVCNASPIILLARIDRLDILEAYATRS